MGRLELRIPLTEVVVVEEDLRRGVMRIVVEGEEYPSWYVGDEVMAMRVDHGSSMVETGKLMLKMDDTRPLRSARHAMSRRELEELVSDERPNA